MDSAYSTKPYPLCSRGRQQFGGIHFDRPGGFDTGDRLRVGELGALRVAELSISKASAAERTRRHINRSVTDLFKIDVQVRGQLVVEHNGRG